MKFWRTAPGGEIASNSGLSEEAALYPELTYSL